MWIGRFGVRVWHSAPYMWRHTWKGTGCRFYCNDINVNRSTTNTRWQQFAVIYTIKLINYSPLQHYKLFITHGLTCRLSIVCSDWNGSGDIVSGLGGNQPPHRPTHPLQTINGSILGRHVWSRDFPLSFANFIFFHIQFRYSPTPFNISLSVSNALF